VGVIQAGSRSPLRGDWEGPPLRGAIAAGERRREIPYKNPVVRVVFLGTPAFAIPSLDALARAGHDLAAVVAQPDRPAGRGHALREPATKAWARDRGVPVLQPEKVRDGRLAADLAALSPDVLCVAAYGRILGKDLLELAPHGAINVHGSLLPRWRGAAPIQWAIASGERETGVTIMQMDEGLDTGDVLLQRAMVIAPDDTAESLGPRGAAPAAAGRGGAPGGHPARGHRPGRGEPARAARAPPPAGGAPAGGGRAGAPPRAPPRGRG
jgi:methionyl-tRNA formyltransferase